MSVTAVIKIQQFDPGSQHGVVQESIVSATSDGDIQEATSGATGTYVQLSLPAISSPVARDTGAGGFVTDDEENWSDSPTRQPDLLYRHRFSWGRDNKELFSADGRGTLNIGSPGARWGNLDDNSAEVIYDRVYPVSAVGSIQQFLLRDSGSVQEKVYTLTSDLTRINEIAGLSGEFTVEEFPFLVIASPVPFSIKNPVNTDVSIRLANFTNPISSGTITLFLDDVLQSNLQVVEFFGGLGGFDVAWDNVSLFNYDAQVDVKWTFADTDVPATQLIIRYPFYTVADLAGPRVLNLVPSDVTTGVQITGPLQFDVEDFEQDVDISSLDLYVNNVLIVNGENGTIELTRLGNKKGYTVKFTPEEPWLYGDLIPIAIFIKDTAVSKNETFFSYSFTTIESNAPRIINITPVICAEDITTGTDISVDIIDDGHGLDKSTVVVTVEEVDKTLDATNIPIVHRDE